jgi:hypothetical protein
VPSLFRGRNLTVTSTFLRRLRTVGSFALAIVINVGIAWAEDHRPVPMVVADFDYVDTSGEVRDQRTEHERRLQTFMRTVRDDLARSGQYRIVPLVCSPTPCPTVGSAQLMKDAHSSGATVLLYGGIHKESTLIQWMKVEAVEVENGKQLFNRLITFRGDTDEAWTRSEQFLIKQLTQDIDLNGLERP